MKPVRPHQWESKYEDHFDYSKVRLGPRDDSFFPFSEVKSSDVSFSEKRVLFFNDVMRLAESQADQQTNRTIRSEEDWYTRYFFVETLMQQLVDEEGVDTQYKILYDLTGSRFRIPLQLSMGFKFKKIYGLELNEQDLEYAATVQRCAEQLSRAPSRVDQGDQAKFEEPILRLLTSSSLWEAQLLSFLEADWVDCDIGFFDTTVFGDCDEGVICVALENRVRMLQPGSYIFIFTKWLLVEPLTWHVRLLKTDERGLTDGTTLKVWLYKTVKQSTDHRTQYIDDNGQPIERNENNPLYQEEGRRHGGQRRSFFGVIPSGLESPSSGKG
mmetsp:Transcript_35137/g.60718  ORF Transcript_35137/g.60718 Transcript_35137/m.60718 type:complete len:327 (-) Transcript_35137:112-1092(-)